MRRHIYLYIILAGLIVASIWHIELTCQVIPGTKLVNGFMRFDGYQVYHVALYTLFGASLVMIGESLFILSKVQRIARDYDRRPE
jgi:hypothetical protein